MKLIIESGSTKTDCALIQHQSTLQRASFTGMNPVTDQSYDEKLVHILDSFTSFPIKDVYYYGAGCVTPRVNQRVENAIRLQLPQADVVEVEYDLLGAARSLCQYSKGIVCILGTGSNIGYYDGQRILRGIASGGYLLGDEGSGFRLGQALYRWWIRDYLTREEGLLIEESLGFSKANAIELLYAAHDHRSYLAGMAPLIHLLGTENRSKICEEVFEELIQQLIQPLFETYACPVYFTGSVAAHFKERIIKLLDKFNIITGSFVQAPLDGLIKFHYGQ